MIWLPGILSQGREFIWNRYTIDYETILKQESEIYPYASSKYRTSKNYNVDGSIFTLRSPTTTNARYFAVGNYFIDIEYNSNSATNSEKVTGAALYKIKSKKHEYSQTEGNSTSGSTSSVISGTNHCVTSISFNEETGLFTGSATYTTGISVGDVFYTTSETNYPHLQSSAISSSIVYKYVVTRVQNVPEMFEWTRTRLSAKENSYFTISYEEYVSEQVPRDFIDTIVSTDLDAYPVNGAQDGYWYILQP